MSAILVTAPTTEPVTLAEAKAHLEVGVTDWDALITTLIGAARRHFERETGRSLITQTWRLDLEAFPAVILLPHGPVIAVTDVDYVDDDGAAAALDGEQYAVDLTGDVPRVSAAPETVFPTAQRGFAAVSVTYTAGYGDAAAVPADQKAAILFLVAHWFLNRESATTGAVVTVPMSTAAIIDSYRIPRLA